MPRLTMQTDHQLGRVEAVRRLKEKFAESRERFGSQVNDLTEEWDGHMYTFGFRAMGMKVAGTITVEDSAVSLAAELPLAAMLVKGMIEQRIREELGGLLA
jgi:hypothetical protein